LTENVEVEEGVEACVGYGEVVGVGCGLVGAYEGEPWEEIGLEEGCVELIKS